MGYQPAGPAQATTGRVELFSGCTCHLAGPAQAATGHSAVHACTCDTGLLACAGHARLGSAVSACVFSLGLMPEIAVLMSLLLCDDWGALVLHA